MSPIFTRVLDSSKTVNYTFNSKCFSQSCCNAFGDHNINNNNVVNKNVDNLLGGTDLCNGNPFASIIPSKYVFSKNKPLLLYFDIFQLENNEFFFKKIDNNIEKGVVYTVFIKVRYNVDSFFMAGSQFGFKYNNKQDVDKFLYSVNARLDNYFSGYNLGNDCIEYIQLSFRKTDNVLLSEFILNKPEHIVEDDYKAVKRNLNIPMSINEASLGKPLLTKLDSENNVTHIFLNIKGKQVNFMDIINDQLGILLHNNPNRVISLHGGYKFYFLKDKIPYVLCVDSTDLSKIEKIRFSLGGVMINRVTDSVVDDYVVRNAGNKVIYFKDNEVMESIQNIKLKPVEKPVIKQIFVSNPNLGSIDCETYLSNDNTYKVYSLGFRTNLHSEPVIYYIDRDLDGDKIVISMINELLRSKYSNTTFYCHNLGNYDIVFILKVLYRHNEVNNNEYIIDCILREDKIIKVTICKKIDTVTRKLTILDSYCWLNNSLKDLGNIFGVDTKKSYFPYKFSTEKTLFYTGNTPDISYYNDLDQHTYNTIYKDNWSFKDETVKYLKDDLNCLYEVLVKANKQIALDYGVQMTESVTISGLALKIFLKSYYHNNIPVINKFSIYKDIKQAYYGGITEVYIPYGKKLYYYDVNSLYPYVALQDMPGVECSKVDYYTGKDLKDLGDIFGFFNCYIDAPLDGYLGVLPMRNTSGIFHPVGKWKGWYFSEELKFAQECGYTIKVLNGYVFNRQSNVFNEYVNKIYNIKSNPINDTQKSMAKSLLNNLLGRFGIALDKPITSILSIPEFETKSLMNKIVSYKFISPDKVLVSYIPKLDTDIIASHNLDILKLVSKYKDHEVQPMHVTSIAISTAITAYGRIHISKLKLDILKRGGKIYYSDTDSIVTNIELPQDYVSRTEIGKLKLEDKISKGIFISGKLYCYIDENGVTKKISKGINSNTITYSAYLKILDNKDVTTGFRKQSNIDWNKGHVTIEDIPITVRSDNYIKRIKIYDKSNKWIDTKPIYINELDAVNESNHTPSSQEQLKKKPKKKK